MLVADNAGDNKNHWTFAFTASTVSCHIFKMAFNLFLRTGHSHEDIDAMFGLWAKCLANQQTLEVPSDFMSVLGVQFPYTTFSLLSYTRDWQDRLADCLFKISGMGNSVGTCHSFAHLRRSTVDVQKYGAIESSFTDAPDPDDVVMLPRKYMHMDQLNQPPVVILPKARFLLMLGREDPMRTVPRLIYNKKTERGLVENSREGSRIPVLVEESFAISASSCKWYT